MHIHRDVCVLGCAASSRAAFRPSGAGACDSCGLRAVRFATSCEIASSRSVCDRFPVPGKPSISPVSSITKIDIATCRSPEVELWTHLVRLASAYVSIRGAVDSLLVFEKGQTVARGARNGHRSGQGCESPVARSRNVSLNAGEICVQGRVGASSARSAARLIAGGRPVTVLQDVEAAHGIVNRSVLRVDRPPPARSNFRVESDALNR